MQVKRCLSVAAVTAMAVSLSVATGSSAAAQGGPCGQSSGSSGSAALGSSSGLLRDFGLPWLTGPPDGGVPQLIGRTKAIEMVTGPGSPNNTIERFSVSGTDLGIMWDARNGDVLMAFGDTVGDCEASGADWRSNVLFRSNDADITDGMSIASSPLDEPNHSKQVINGLLNLPPGSPVEYTVIPTAGVAVGTDQYVRYMSVRSWDTPGNWTTNYSGLARSTDNGENWTTVPSTARVNTPGLEIPGIPAVSAGNENFQQSAFVSGSGSDGWVYEFGTPSGRFGPARLARVQGAQINDLAAYEYWNGSSWEPDITAAAEVIPGTVSELSVQWNDYLNKYVAMYTDPAKGLVIRQADRLEGPWSGTQTLLNTAMLPGLYGGFMHPQSSGQFLHFVATTWNRYNVIYMRTDLDGLQMAATDSVDRPDPIATGEARVLDVEHPDE